MAIDQQREGVDRAPRDLAHEGRIVERLAMDRVRSGNRAVFSRHRFRAQIAVEGQGYPPFRTNPRPKRRGFHVLCLPVPK